MLTLKAPSGCSAVSGFIYSEVCALRDPKSWSIGFTTTVKERVLTLKSSSPATDDGLGHDDWYEVNREESCTDHKEQRVLAATKPGTKYILDVRQEPPSPTWPSRPDPTAGTPARPRGRHCPPTATRPWSRGPRRPARGASSPSTRPRRRGSPARAGRAPRRAR